MPLAFALVACGGEATQELPFVDVSIALYTQPLVSGDDGRFTLVFPRDDTQYVEVAIPPDRGVYVLLVAGTMKLTVPDAPEVGSTLTVHELALAVTRDDFLPQGWMLGAKLEMHESVAECVESADWGTRWVWQSVGELHVTTRDGRGRQTLTWLPDVYSGSLSGAGDAREFFVPSLSFGRQEATP
jgi:hypothetical protein